MTWKEAVVVVGLIGGLGAMAFVEGRIFERLSTAEMAGEQTATIEACKRGLAVEAIEIQQLQSAAASCKPADSGAAL